MHDPNAIIDKLGGTSAVAQIFGIKPGSVSEWRHTGIPPARLMYIKLAYPELFSSASTPTNHEPATAAAA
ncbi:hypothetical protein [Cupriavidus sp. BIC8F]|uniref:hypothetical protein n=1 Tax=Cupriavidus sp. BIC8F TaxID=3079014 RepID=UPI002916C0EE|nr:hypothetical protein [Cupriavidus sp. BIC8F]